MKKKGRIRKAKERMKEKEKRRKKRRKGKLNKYKVMDKDECK